MTANKNETYKSHQLSEMLGKASSMSKYPCWSKRSLSVGSAEEVEYTRRYLKSHQVSKWLIKKAKGDDKVKDKYIKSPDAIRGEGQINKMFELLDEDGSNSDASWIGK